MSDWGSTQSLLQLAVTLNFGVTVIVQLREAGIGVEKSIVSSFEEQVSKADGTNPLWEQGVIEAIGEFNRIHEDKNWAVLLSSKRWFGFTLYGISIVALVLLIVATVQSGPVWDIVPVVGAIFCVTPVTAGAALMIGEGFLLRQLQECRNTVIERFSSSRNG